MKHLSGWKRYQQEALRGVYFACGHFDGMHLGHRALAARLATAARQAGRPSVLVSLYDPAQPALTTEREKAYLLQESGIDLLFSLPRAEAVGLSPAALAARLDAAAVVTVKADAARWRRCDLPILFCDLVRQEGQICSDRLRAALQQADMTRYTELAGRAYLLLGPVVHGAGRGRTVGQPTANLGLPARKLLPPHGVYATISRVAGGVYMGLTNIGRRPTVDDFSYVTVETFLLDFDRDIYGEWEALELCFLIRGVRKFDSLAAVREQVQRDLQQARQRLAAIYNAQR